MPRSLIIAHRGASADAPENTLPAFQRAIELGADGVEFDVRLAKDGAPVVVHDADLRRVAGRSELIADTTAAGLASLAGVPALSDVLDLYRDNGAIHVELKIGSKREARPLVDAVAATVRESPILPRMVLSSFYLPAIAAAKLILPELRTSALFAPALMRVLKRRRHMISLARSFGADGISPHRLLVTKEFARLAAEAGMPVTVWTCDNPRWLRTARRLGLSALITNDPLRMIRAGRE